MTDMIDASRQPVVYVRNGEVFANSRDVASYFEKAHKDVLRAISTLSCSTQFTERNFAPSSYRDTTGRELPMVEMMKDGFAFLAMGFTGAKAARFKEAYIEQFNRMETELRNRSSTAIPDLSDPVILVQLLTEHASKRIEAEKRATKAEAAVEAVKPKTMFYDQFVSADGLYGLQNAARVLNEPPNKFIGWLKQGYLFYQGGCLVPRVQYRNQGIFEVKATIVDDKARYQTYVTPKGIRHLAGKLHKPVDLFNTMAR